MTHLLRNDPGFGQWYLHPESASGQLPALHQKQLNCIADNDERFTGTSGFNGDLCCQTVSRAKLLYCLPGALHTGWRQQSDGAALREQGMRRLCTPRYRSPRQRDVPRMLRHSPRHVERARRGRRSDLRA